MANLLCPSRGGDRTWTKLGSDGWAVWVGEKEIDEGAEVGDGFCLRVFMGSLGDGVSLGY